MTSNLFFEDVGLHEFSRKLGAYVTDLSIYTDRETVDLLVSISVSVKVRPIVS